MIASLTSSYPGLAPQLLDESGGLNRFVNVYLNDTDVRHLQELATPVDDRDTLLLLPAMAGGAGTLSSLRLYLRTARDLRVSRASLGGLTLATDRSPGPAPSLANPPRRPVAAALRAPTRRSRASLHAHLPGEPPT